MISVATLNKKVMAAFAEPVTFKPAAGDVELLAVFEDNIEDSSAGNVKFGLRVYTLTLNIETVEAHAITLQQAVTVRGTDYRIVDRQDDSGGLTILKLQKY